MSEHDVALARLAFGDRYASALLFLEQKEDRLATTRAKLEYLETRRRAALHPNAEDDARAASLRGQLEHDGLLYRAALEGLGAVLYDLKSPHTPESL